MKQKNNLHFILLLVILIITSILLFKFYFLQEKTLKPQLVYGLERGGFIGNYFFDFRNWTNDFLHFNNLRRQISELEHQNIKLINQFQNFKEIKEENSLLKKALKIKDETGWSLVSAKIILMDPSGLTGSFWINKGTRAGLKKGMNVILEDKILVGRLVECFDNYCRGESIFSPKTKISVEDLRSSTLAIAEKDIKGNFRLKLVPYESDIEIGDVLTTSSENIKFFKGLLVAKVKESGPSSSNVSSLKEFVLEPLVNFSQISSVLIVIDIIPMQQ